MKIALCFSGEARAFEQGYEYYKRNLFDHYDVDVYIHTWTLTEHKRLIKLYDPKSYIIADKPAVGDYNKKYPRTPEPENRPPWNAYCMFYSMYKSSQLLAGEYDWVITNPPFKIPNDKGVLKNAIFILLLHFATKAKKGIALLVSDYVFNSLTPVRIKKMASLGFYLKTLTICAVKEWRGRYYFMVWTREPNNFLNCLTGTYSNKII